MKAVVEPSEPGERPTKQENKRKRVTIIRNDIDSLDAQQVER